MKKSLSIVLVTLVLLLTLTACKNQPINKTEEYKENLTFSNLVDEESQKEVRKAMESAEIPTGSIDLFFEDVNNFNSTIEEKSLVKDGFTTIDSLEPEYDLYAMQGMLEAKNPEFIG